MSHEISVAHHFEAAHRLPQLDGKCQSLHGHTWNVAVTVAAAGLDQRSLVVEFGLLKAFLRDWLDTHLDHATMLGATDPLVAPLISAGTNVYQFGRSEGEHQEDSLVSDLQWPTVEAVATLVYRVADLALAATDCGGHARISRSVVSETATNSAAYTP